MVDSSVITCVPMQETDPEIRVEGVVYRGGVGGFEIEERLTAGRAVMLRTIQRPGFFEKSPSSCITLSYGTESSKAVKSHDRLCQVVGKNPWTPRLLTKIGLSSKSR